MTKSAPDTVCARATSPGLAGIAVVRVSGPDALTVLDDDFRGAKLSQTSTRSARTGWLHAIDGSRLDRVVATAFRAPGSYTGENMLEVSCHGSEYIVAAIVRLLRNRGCRLAEPGEFTRRAVLNGKLTLNQAEAVLDLVKADNATAHASALSRYQGSLGRYVAGIRERLVDVAAEVEYHLGFEESDSAMAPRPRPKIRGIIREISRAIKAGNRNRRVHDRARVAIVGRPNVGKSSLFNRLVGDDRAIVAARPGTTRDRVDADVDFGSTRLRLMDTGGLGSRARGAVARGTASRALAAVSEADLVLAVFDRSRRLSPGDRAVLKAASGRPTLCVLNKSDLPARLDSTALDNGRQAAAIEASAVTGASVPRIKSMLARRFRPDHSIPVTTRRHVVALEDCRGALERTLGAPDVETAAIEIGTAIEALGRLDTAVTSEEVLDRVFSQFCIGK